MKRVEKTYKKQTTSEEQLKERLKFETLFADISSRFVNVPAQDVDSEIMDAERRICELLDLDVAAFWQWSDEGQGFFALTHYYSAREGQQLTEQSNSLELFPWFQQQMRAGHIVAISSLEELPAEAANDREICRQLDIKSNLSLPLSVGGEPALGVLGLNTSRSERDWPDELVKRMQLVGQIFANAIARKRSSQQLQESEEVNRATFEQAAVGIAHVGIDGNWLRVNDRLCFIVGYSREELLRMTFQDITHPDDLETDLEYIHQVLSGEIKTYSMEKRYFRKDRSLVWVNLTVSLVRDSSGEPRHFISVVENISERKLAEQALEERVKFETLLADISARFVNLPSDRIESEIDDTNHRICELLDIDRATLWQVSEEDPGMLLLTHLYQPQGITTPPDRMNARDFFPWTVQKILGGETVAISKMADLPPEANRDRESFRTYSAKSGVYVPLSVGEGAVLGLLTFAVLREERSWPETVVMGFKLIAQVFANALERKRMDDQLREHIQEIAQLKERLERENIYLQEEIKLLVEHKDIVGQSVAMKKVLTQAEQVAQTDSTVFLQGETGTGKDLLARAIHRMSLRKDRPLVTVNCASLPPTLIESELFGREKGAYTGAMTKMVGRFEVADGSTLFLDEIGELPLDLQSKLLRVLEDGTIERLGSTKPVHVNVRIIAATNRDIEQAVKNGKFRQDLYYRLNVFPIVIPPLRKRPEDIPPLVRAVVKEFKTRMGKEIESIPKKTMQALQSYSWPGNVRELRNVIEHAMIVSNKKNLEVQVPQGTSTETDGTGNFRDMERTHIVAVLEKTGWRIAGTGGAAEVLGMKRTTLRAKMKKLGIKRSSKTHENG
jgi:PAS domain S-box-containing protein